MRPLFSIIMLGLALGGLGVAPGLAKSHRTLPCAFPDGWNPVDHQRQLDEIPPDAHHMCDVDAGGHPLDSHGRPTR